MFPWDDTARIQKDFMRADRYTHLFVTYGDHTLRWTFTFRDFGMDHTVERAFRVIGRDDGRWSVQARGSDDVVLLDSSEYMLNRVFGAPYRRAVQQLYYEMRVRVGFEPAATGPEAQTHDTSAAPDSVQSQSAIPEILAQSSPPYTAQTSAIDADPGSTASAPSARGPSPVASP